MSIQFSSLPPIGSNHSLSTTSLMGSTVLLTAGILVIQTVAMKAIEERCPENYFHNRPRGFKAVNLTLVAALGYAGSLAIAALGVKQVQARNIALFSVFLNGLLVILLKDPTIKVKVSKSTSADSTKEESTVTTASTVKAEGTSPKSESGEKAKTEAEGTEKEEATKEITETTGPKTEKGKDLREELLGKKLIEEAEKEPLKDKKIVVLSDKPLEYIELDADSIAKSLGDAVKDFKPEELAKLLVKKEIGAEKGKEKVEEIIIPEEFEADQEEQLAQIAILEAIEKEKQAKAKEKSGPKLVVGGAVKLVTKIDLKKDAFLKKIEESAKKSKDAEQAVKDAEKAAKEAKEKKKAEERAAKLAEKEKEASKDKEVDKNDVEPTKVVKPSDDKEKAKVDEVDELDSMYAEVPPEAAVAPKPTMEEIAVKVQGVALGTLAALGAQLQKLDK